MELVKVILAKMARLIIYIAMVFSFFNPVIAKSDTIKIVAPIFGEKLLSEGLSGFWADMYRQIVAGLVSPLEFVALPFKRSLVDFKTEKFECIWSVDKKLLAQVGLDVTYFIESDIIFESGQYVFLAQGQLEISSLDGLRGKRVGIGGGSSHEDYLRSIDSKIVLLSDQSSKLRMLQNDRIDAFIGWLPDIFIMEKSALSNPILLRNSLKLASSGSAFVCHNTPQNAVFIKNINTAIRAYKVSDQFTLLFESYGASQMLEDQYK